MSTLTKQEARQLADLFTDFAPAIGKYRYDQWEQLSDNKRQLLMDLEYDLMEKAAKLSALAGILTLEEVEASVTEIAKAVVQAEKFLKKVAAIKTGLNVVTSVFKLATAVMAKDPKAILKEIKAVKKLVSQP
jgi:hypothetical protein